VIASRRGSQSIMSPAGFPGDLLRQDARLVDQTPEGRKVQISRRTGDRVAPRLTIDHEFTQHVPEPNKHLVRYFAWYSNKTRGLRARAAPTDTGETDRHQAPTAQTARRRWAALIKHVWRVDPLQCPRCQGPMKLSAPIRRGREGPVAAGRKAPAAVGVARRAMRGSEESSLNEPAKLRPPEYRGSRRPPLPT
jgi:hypothetical protein